MRSGLAAPKDIAVEAKSGDMYSQFVWKHDEDSFSIGSGCSGCKRIVGMLGWELSFVNRGFPALRAGVSIETNDELTLRRFVCTRKDDGLAENYR
jgi:hypothetical protein